jgi:NADH-quinone oxidoreductase subunit M
LAITPSLVLILNLLAFGIFGLFLIPSYEKFFLKNFTLGIATLVFLTSLGLVLDFDKYTEDFQFVTDFTWLPGIDLHFGIDGISVFFILLTSFLFCLCILANWQNVQHRLKEYFLCLLLMEILLFGVFSSLDILMFYICFETILIPMYLLIGLWGSGRRRIHAANLFFFYTLAGSLSMLCAIAYMYAEGGTTNYVDLLSFNWSKTEQKVLWFAFFISFASKIPMLPVHIWLPEAHVEAPTTGSVLLAGILLKLGAYGFLRFSLPLFSWASLYFTPLVYSLSLVGIIYTSFTAIRQVDLKRIIAYTSIAHMNLVVLGIFSFNTSGLQGGILQSLSHGFISSGLFLAVGVLYDRYLTRIIKYYGGLAHVMPLFASVFLFLSMANIGLPGTSSFVGEFLIFVGVFEANTTACFFGATGMILSGIYSLWLLNRICYGNLSTEYIYEFSDLNRREFMIFLPLILGSIFIGIYPEILMDYMEYSIAVLVKDVFYI